MGVLGLSTTYQDIELEIDYNIDVEYLFFRFAWKYLDRRYLEIFPRGNQFEEWSPVTSRLPSWVPDWRIKRRTHGFHERDIFYAGTGVDPLLILTSQSPRRLEIQGTLVDTVKMITTNSFESSKPWTLSELHSYISEFKSLYKTQQLGLSPRNIESVEHLFARFLGCDCRRDIYTNLLRSSDPNCLLTRFLDFEDYILNSAYTS
jgi:hypothetical protein